MRWEPVPEEARREGDAAATLTLVALVLYGVFGALFLLIGALVAALAGALASGVFLFLGIFPLAFLVLAHQLVYARLKEGRYAEAATPCLVLGIVSLFVGGVISGILLLVAYAKAKAAGTMVRLAARIREELAAPALAPPSIPAQPAAPSEAAPPALPTCGSCGWQAGPRDRFCTNCGRPLATV